MVLVVGNNVVLQKSPTILEHFLHASSRILDDVHTFKEKEEKVLKETDGLLYVNQHEFAMTYPDDPNVTYFGSEDATTCHVVILRQPTTGVTAMAHLDGGDQSSKVIERIAKEIFQVSEELYQLGGTGKTLLEISIMGGFEDEQQRSQKLSLDILRGLVKSEIHFILGLCCIGSLNTKINDNIPYPMFYGCAVDVKSGDIFPARFPDAHGPENILRHVRCSFIKSDEAKNIYPLYNCQTGVMEIEPFQFQHFPWLHLWCQASPKDILENMSTSPKVEPAYFVPTLKAVMQFILDNPHPRKSVFLEGKPLKFKRIDGVWQKLPPSSTFKS